MKNIINLSVIFLVIFVILSTESTAADRILPLSKPTVDQEIKSITNKKKYTEFWTDMLFLSIKKGDKFGPFGKLY